MQIGPVTLEGAHVRLESMRAGARRRPGRRGHGPRAVPLLPVLARDGGGDARLRGALPRGPREGDRAALHDDRPEDGPDRRLDLVPRDRARAQAARDRRHLDHALAPAQPREHRGEAPAAQPLLRGAGLQPGRVQDRRAQREVARRARADRRDRGRHLPRAHGHARRRAARLGLLQRDRERVAGGEGAASREARPRSRGRGSARANSKQRRLLPMPASATTPTTWPCPPRVRSSASSSAAMLRRAPDEAGEPARARQIEARAQRSRALRARRRAPARARP